MLASLLAVLLASLLAALPAPLLAALLASLLAVLLASLLAALPAPLLAALLASLLAVLPASLLGIWAARLGGAEPLVERPSTSRSPRSVPWPVTLQNLMGRRRCSDAEAADDREDGVYAERVTRVVYEASSDGGSGVASAAAASAAAASAAAAPLSPRRRLPRPRACASASVSALADACDVDVAAGLCGTEAVAALVRLAVEEPCMADAARLCTAAAAAVASDAAADVSCAAALAGAVCVEVLAVDSGLALPVETEVSGPLALAAVGALVLPAGRIAACSSWRTPVYFHSAPATHTPRLSTRT